MTKDKTWADRVMQFHATRHHTNLEWVGFFREEVRRERADERQKVCDDILEKLPKERVQIEFPSPYVGEKPTVKYSCEEIETWNDCREKTIKTITQIKNPTL